MKANNTELVHKTVAELFDMVKEQQKRIGLLEKRNKVLSEALYVKTDAYYFNEIMQKVGAIK